MKNCFKIYGLVNPNEPEKIRYIGQTSKSLKVRLRNHIDKAKREKALNHRICWLKSLLIQDLQPTMILIEDNLTQQEANIKEKFYIKLFKSMGANLVNTSEGGEYAPTSEETREKLSKKLRVFNITKEELYKLYITENKSTNEITKFYGCSKPLIIQKLHKFQIPIKKINSISKDILYNLYYTENKTIMEIAKILNVSESAIRRAFYKYCFKKRDWKHTEQTKQKISILAKGRKMSDEAKQKISNSLKGKPRPKKTYKPLLTKEELKKLSKKYSQRKIAKITNIPVGRVKYMFKYYKITTQNNNKKQKQVKL